ncbi:MAG: DUF4157 domain-containing protein [Aureispira sp.]
MPVHHDQDHEQQTQKESINNQQQGQSSQQEGQRKPNKTGIPDRLKAVIEHFSGFSLDKVRVHYNSDKPALMDAHAYAEGFDIYIGPGQEKHLAHELWHVVQQMKGEVSSKEEVNGRKANTDKDLEKKASTIGNKAEQQQEGGIEQQETTPLKEGTISSDIAQFVLTYKGEQLRNMRELAGNREGAFDAYRGSEDASKKAKLEHPDKVYDLENNLAEVEAAVEEVAPGAWRENRALVERLDGLAREYSGERCHECATDMQDAFGAVGGSEVLEIYTEDGDTYITVMESRVRNHYVNLFEGLVFDSSTGSAGVALDDYLAALSETNPDLRLQHKVADPN